MTDSNATELLRKLLDERGIHYKAWDGGTHPMTVWYVDGFSYEFIEYRLINGAKAVSNAPWDDDGHCMLTITNRHATPEQAVAATLGAGTCELAYGEDDEGYDGWYCQSCGGWFDAVRRDSRLVEPMRCGCCGKAVKL